eukprot:6021271-Alexandrium_andersonii.AAC.1
MRQDVRDGRWHRGEMHSGSGVVLVAPGHNNNRAGCVYIVQSAFSDPPQPPTVASTGRPTTFPHILAPGLSGHSHRYIRMYCFGNGTAGPSVMYTTTTSFARPDTN